MPEYMPLFTITPMIISLISEISVMVGHITAFNDHSDNLHLRKPNRIRTIQGSLAIEGNTLTEEQITAILEGKRVVAPIREIWEVQNAIRAYDNIDKWLPNSEKDILKAHGILMDGKESTKKTDSSCFIEFMLRMIAEALRISVTPGVTPGVIPEVKKMLLIINGEMTRKEIQKKLGLKDEKNFRERYIQPMSVRWPIGRVRSYPLGVRQAG